MVSSLRVTVKFKTKTNTTYGEGKTRREVMWLMSLSCNGGCFWLYRKVAIGAIGARIRLGLFRVLFHFTKNHVVARRSVELPAGIACFFLPKVRRICWCSVRLWIPLHCEVVMISTSSTQFLSFVELCSSFWQRVCVEELPNAEEAESVLPHPHPRGCQR